MSTVSPYMGLTISTIGTDSGLQWEQNLNASLVVIDEHNHATGSGAPIQPNGMNINADLPFNGNNLTAVRAARFNPQSVPIPNSGVDIGELYVSGNELYYNDVTGGHQIQITNVGSVNAGAGSITGLPSGTASATFSVGTFVWQSATSTAANMDFGSAILRNSGASSFGLTLQAPTLAANTVQTLPQTPTGSTSIMQMDTSGNMSAALNVDNSTLAITANLLTVKAGGITTTQISNTAGITGSQLSASAGIVGGQIADQTITEGKLALKTVASGAALGGVAITVIASYDQTSTSFLPQTASATATITIASPAVITVASTAAMYVGMPVVFTTTGALPTGIVSGTTYFISAIPGGTTFRISATVYGTDINTSGSQSGTQTSKVTSSSVALTTGGRPVSVGLLPNGTSLSEIAGDFAGGTAILFKIKRSGTVIASLSVGPGQNDASNRGHYPPAIINVMDYPTAGNYSYTIESAVITPGDDAIITNCALTAYEI